MKISFKIFLVPLVIIVMFFINAFTPVEVLGCYTRGMVAFIIAVVSGIAAIVTAIVSIRKRIVNDPSSIQSISMTLILSIPLIALLYLA